MAECQRLAMVVGTGKPSRAYWMEGARRSARGRVPNCWKERLPAVDAAGDGPREGADLGDFGEVFLLEDVEVEVLRGAAGSVEAVEFIVFGGVDDGEEISADAAGHGFHEAHGGVGGDGGVDGVAAGLEDVEADLGGEGVGGGDHSMIGGGVGGGAGGGEGHVLNPVIVWCWDVEDTGNWGQAKSGCVISRL